MPASRTAIVAALALVGATSGCGDAPGPPSFSFPKPIASGFTCLDEATAFTGMTADAYVAGYDQPCPLDVDATRFAVSGTCSGIAIGALRHVMIVYTRPADATSAAVTLAYAIGSVDLRRDQLAVNAGGEVVVALRGSEIIYEQPVIDGIVLDGGTCKTRDGSDPLQWAKCWIDDELHTSLACGGNTAPNIARACANNLACP